MSFLRALFDISFREMITGKIIGVLYVLAMIGIALGYVSATISAFTNGVLSGFLVLVIVGPLISLLALAYIRVLLELFMVLFRIYDNTQRMVLLSSPPAPPYNPAFSGHATAPPVSPPGGTSTSPATGTPTTGTPIP